MARRGFIWHTQGSGKSLLMAFFAGMLVHHEDLHNPTLVVLTDRNDLDNQLFGTFSRCAELFGQDPQQVTEGMEDSEKAKFAGKWSTLETLAGASERLDELAALIVHHFENRQQAISGKGMIVCMSRRICVDLYTRITALRPAWYDPADDKGKLIKVVMTGSAADPLAYQPHIRSKKGMDDLARRYRDPGDDFQLVIVRDMWLTGFDCPSMHTLYIDQPVGLLDGGD